MTTNRAKAGKKKKANITDRETANRAKVYVYGMKAHKRQEAVKTTNVCIAECMRSITPEPETETETESYTITASSNTSTLTFGFRNSIRITVFVLYLYMVWSFLST
jgi:hypothetical protein